MIKLTIDNKQIEVKKETTVLQAAKTIGIDIPTLCYNEAISPYGACRLCLVEITKEEWKGWSRLVVSCAYPVAEGLIVKTDSEKVLKARRFVLELLLARCPDGEVIQNLAKKYGISQPRFPSLVPRPSSLVACILCGLCVRVCSEIIGRNSISFTGRGAQRKVMTPFDSQSDVCVGCGACAFVCPTGTIKIEDIFNKRKLHTWKTELEIKKCKICGNGFSTITEMKHLREKIELPEEAFDMCPKCRREIFKNKLIEVM